MKRTPRARSSLEQYVQEINSIPLLTRDEEWDLARQIQAGCPVAREKLIRANLRLVVAFAKRFLGRGVEIEEIVAAGNLGLIKGVESFDPDRGCRFSTYGGLWILQAMRKAVDELAPTVRIPAYMVQLLAQWKRARQLLSEELKRSPTSGEIAQRVGIPPKKIPNIEAALKAFRLAPGEICDSSDFEEPQDTLIDNTCGPQESAADSDLLVQLHQNLGLLPQKEQELLRLCYGIGDSEAIPLKTAGRLLGIPAGREKAVRESALSHLAERIATI